MRWLPSDAISARSRHRTPSPSEADLPDDCEPPSTESVLFRLGLLLLIALGFALAAQFLVGAPH
jgi:hypothetical protein